MKNIKFNIHIQRLENEFLIEICLRILPYGSSCGWGSITAVSLKDP